MPRAVRLLQNYLNKNTLNSPETKTLKTDQTSPHLSYSDNIGIDLKNYNDTVGFSRAHGRGGGEFVWSFGRSCPVAEEEELGNLSVYYFYPTRGTWEG